MINAWSLFYDEINGTLDEEYPIMSKNNDDVIVFGKEEDSSQDFWKDDGYSLTGNPDPYDYYGEGGAFSFAGTPKFSSASSDTITLGPTRLKGGMGEDHLSLNYNNYYKGIDPYPTLGSIDDKPKPDLENHSSRKYQEDVGIKDLKDYVASTYTGHYTNDASNVQTLDLIHSVGDAESFCRSNAIKYLSMYDKKGQAKRDILKAMHYCLLLYYFSGQTNDEITTHGYETF